MLLKKNVILLLCIFEIIKRRNQLVFLERVSPRFLFVSLFYIDGIVIKI